MMSVPAFSTDFLPTVLHRDITQYTPLIRPRNPNRSARKKLYWAGLHAKDLKLSYVAFLGNEASWLVA